MPVATDVFGIQLPGSLQAIIERIQRVVNQPVQFLRTTNANFVEGARVENSTPLIWLRDPDGITLEVIAHGLMHLDCETSGYPRIRTLRQRTSRLKDQFVSELTSLVEHQVIYPRLRQLGFSPEQQMEVLARRVFLPALREPNPFPMRVPRTRQIFLAVRYAQIRLETPTGDVQATVESWYQSQAGQERQLGLQLVSTIQSADVDNPAQYQTALIACIHILGCEEWASFAEVHIPYPRPTS